MSRMRAVRVAAVGLALAAGVLVALALVLDSSDSTRDRTERRVPALPLDRGFASAREGVRARYPRGWHATTHNETFVPLPALCVTLNARRPHVQVKFVEYLPPALGPGDLTERDGGGELLYPHRPAHFRLGALGWFENSWTHGKLTSFQDHGRVIYVGVVLPRRAGPQMRETVAAIVDSLRVEPRRRCRPSSGVGSRRFEQRMARRR